MAVEHLPQPFLPAPVPAQAVDQPQMNWNARQWRELGNYVATLEQRIQTLEARIAVLEP